MCGMDKSVGKSQVINSSVSTSTLTHDGHVTANPNNPAEFVNRGLPLEPKQRAVDRTQEACQPTPTAS